MIIEIARIHRTYRLKMTFGFVAALCERGEYGGHRPPLEGWSRRTMKIFLQNRRASLGILAAATSLVAALAYHVICGEHGYLSLQREKQQYQVLQKQASQLQQENDKLQKQITALKNDPKTIEKRAREDSLMAKPGEIIIRYSDSTAKDSGSAAKQDGTPPAPATAAQPSK